jgi:pimeloyl-ACP methyl ester carboxylesterase
MEHPTPMPPAPSSSSEPTYHYATVAGSTLAYLDQGSGFPVLLGHSYLWDAQMWRPQIDALSRHFRVIAPDLWGHGRSGPAPAGIHGMQDLARHHLALLDALGIEACHLVGLSIGGMWGEALAQLAPDRIRKLVLMDTFVGAEPAAPQAKYLGLFRQIEADRALSPALLDIVVPIFFRPGIDRDSALFRDFRASLAALPQDRLLGSIVPLGRMLFTREDRMPGLAALRAAETLVLVGEDDIPRPLGEAAEMAARIGCTLRTIPDAGHISSLENPEAVTRALLDFLGPE